VIVLGARGSRCERRHEAEEGKDGCITYVHGPLPISGE
jgi:hypothetical protein